MISGLALTSTGHYELSIAEAEKAIALDPERGPAYSNKTFNQLLLDRLDDAMLTVGLATERKLGWENHNLVLYFVACLPGNDESSGGRPNEPGRAAPRRT